MYVPTFIACHQCDSLQSEVALPVGGTARCRCCDSVLYHNRKDGFNRALAYTLAALALFVIANLFPVASIQAQGQLTQATLLGIVHMLYLQQQSLLAILVLATLVLAPALEIFSMCYLLLPIKLGWPLHEAKSAFRLRQLVAPWVLVDVFMLGVMVALIKLSSVSSIIVGIALYALGGLVILFAATASAFDAHKLWAVLSRVSHQPAIFKPIPDIDA